MFFRAVYFFFPRGLTGPRAGHLNQRLVVTGGRDEEYNWRDEVGIVVAALDKLGPGQLGPNCPGPTCPLFGGGQLGPRAQLSGAQLSGA